MASDFLCASDLVEQSVAYTFVPAFFSESPVVQPGGEEKAKKPIRNMGQSLYMQKIEVYGN